MVVLVVDRLGAGWCGPYGGAFADTPCLNALAAESLVVDWCFTESPRLDAAYQSLWAADADGATLPERAGRLGRVTRLITDELEVAQLPLAEAFGDAWTYEPPQVDRLAASVARTQVAQLMDAAADELLRLGPGAWVWIHAQAMQGLWDAPYAHRLRFVEHEDDPQPSRSAAPPQRRLQAQDDPDIAFGASQCYAAQLEVVDACLHSILAVVQGHGDNASPAEQPWLCVLSPRGYPLGQHGRIGHGDEALYSELIQVPLIIRPPGGLPVPQRTPSLLQLQDVGRWLRMMVERPELDAAAALRDLAARGRAHVVCVAEGQQAVRTRQWFARRQGQDWELYVKPDDRWEANEISARCPDAVEEMQALLAGEAD